MSFLRNRSMAFSGRMAGVGGFGASVPVGGVWAKTDEPTRPPASRARVKRRRCTWLLLGDDLGCDLIILAYPFGHFECANFLKGLAGGTAVPVGLVSQCECDERAGRPASPVGRPGEDTNRL